MDNFVICSAFCFMILLSLNYKNPETIIFKAISLK